MRKINVCKSSVVIFLIFILTCAPEPIEESYQPIPSNQNSVLLTLINNERASNGLTPLIPEELLTSICEEKCDDMIETHNVTHENYLDRFEESNATVLLENIGYGFSTDNGLFQAYIKSPEHRYNILNKNITHIGVYTKNKYNCCLFANY